MAIPDIRFHQPRLALRSPLGRASGVPRRITSFVAREDDIASVTAALGDGPLVTLTGVGGVGKTRLALEVASRMEERFDDGACFCELAPLDDGSAVGHAVAAALRLQQQQGLGIEATVIEFLRTHKMLLLVDNCEHVLPAAARLVDDIVRHCPDVVVLATSREALGVEGERILPVAPLPVEDATELFAERAKAGRPDFDLDHEPVGAVAEICRRLDGLPLAIELAAARMRAMSSLDVARRLDRLRLLSGGVRDALPRQQSLIATIDWSYRLLTAAEQAMFIRLSVFAGGFDLEAAHNVCGADGATDDDTLELLTGLLDKSMVKMRAGTVRSRYFLLETLRAYGRDRLRENAIADELISRHAEYYTDLAERAAIGMHGPEEGAWVERMLPDYDNLRVAFEHVITDGDVDTALRLVSSLSEFVHLRIGYEASGWAERTVELAEPDHPLFAAAVGFAAQGSVEQGPVRAGAFVGEYGGRPMSPAAATAASHIRVTCLRTWLCTRVTRRRRWLTTTRRWRAPAATTTGSGWCGRCSTSRYATPRCGPPTTAWPLRRRPSRFPMRRPTPPPGLWRGTRWAWCCKKSKPDRALALFDEAADLAASVQNFWWHGIALMEAAATRAVHGETATAAEALIDVIDHWDRVGDWSQQWLNLRYVTRFLARVGADDEALALHHALVAAGKGSPLTSDQNARPGADKGQSLTGPEAVALARSALAQHADANKEMHPEQRIS